MHAITQWTAPSDTVKSLTLAEYASPPRHQTAQLPLIGRFLTYVKLALMAWGAISVGAIGGMAMYYLNGDADAPLLVSESRPTPVRAAPAVPAAMPAKDRLAALVESPSASLYAPPEGLAQALMLRAPTPIVEARLPRPRPEEPIYTGSIRPPAYDPRYVAPQRRRGLDPCVALRNLGAPFLFGNRCGHYTRVYPAPPRAQQVERIAAPPRAQPYAPLPAQQYAPRPYQPPTIIAD